MSAVDVRTATRLAIDLSDGLQTVLTPDDTIWAWTPSHPVPRVVAMGHVPDILAEDGAYIEWQTESRDESDAQEWEQQDYDTPALRRLYARSVLGTMLVWENGPDGFSNEMNMALGA